MQQPISPIILIFNQLTHLLLALFFFLIYQIGWDFQRNLWTHSAPSSNSNPSSQSPFCTAFNQTIFQHQPWAWRGPAGCHAPIHVTLPFSYYFMKVFFLGLGPILMESHPDLLIQMLSPNNVQRTEALRPDLKMKEWSCWAWEEKQDLMADGVANISSERGCRGWGRGRKRWERQRGRRRCASAAGFASLRMWTFPFEGETPMFFMALSMQSKRRQAMVAHLFPNFVWVPTIV